MATELAAPVVGCQRANSPLPPARNRGVALGLGVKVARSIGFACLACSAVPARQASTLNAMPREPPPSAEPAHERNRLCRELARQEPLFLMKNARAELELRAGGGDFAHPLASNAEHVLYDPALELAWFSNEQELVGDRSSRSSARARVAPVLIAGKLPPHVEIHVDRGDTNFVEPVDACDLAPILVLHWVAGALDRGRPRSALDRARRQGLARARAESCRRARGEERWLHPSDAHVALPPARARCEDAEWCGASQPFVPSDWELVLTDQSEGADCWHFGCLASRLADGSIRHAAAAKPMGSRRGRALGVVRALSVRQSGHAPSS